jgi:hypothetical protein
MTRTFRTRRRLLSAGALTGVGVGLRGPAGALGGLAALLAPTPARAEVVTVVLAVCAAIASLIAAHNRGDGGLSAALRALMEVQQVLITQIVTLNEAVAKVLQEVKSLKKDFREALFETRLAELHSAIIGAQGDWQTEMQRAARFPSYQAWQADSFTKDKLRNIYDMAHKAFLRAQAETWCDPLTAVYLPVALNLTIAVRTAQGETRERMAPEVQAYLNLYAAAQNPMVKDSTAAKLKTHWRNYLDRVAELETRGFRVNDATLGWNPALAMVATIEDFVADTTKCVPNRPTPYQRREGIDPGCHDVLVPGRIGPRSTYVYETKVEQYPYVDKNHPGGEFLQYRLAPEELRDPTEFDPQDGALMWAPTDVPPLCVDALDKDARRNKLVCAPAAVPLVRVDAPSEKERMDLARGPRLEEEWTKRRAELASSLEALNLELANIGLCLSSIAAVESSRSAIYREFTPGRL